MLNRRRNMADRIMCVDDDHNILAAYRRVLHRTGFEVVTAVGGEEGLGTLAESGPFAVVLSDMRMPGMDGIRFLMKVKERAPDTVRMMLTGHADLQTATDAVNEGNIFRFLRKPCPKDVLIGAMTAGVRQYQLITAERSLLEETLNASVKVLTDVLALVNPIAFGRASRIRLYVQHIVRELQLPDAWRFETAAMLSQIGWVTLPPEALEKIYAAQDLSPEEESALAAHPEVAGRLLANIPRLEDVAHMIARQEEPFCWHRLQDGPSHREVSALGGHILKVALGLDRLVTRGVSPGSAIEQLRSQPKEFDPGIVATLEGLRMRTASSRLEALDVAALDVGMILEQDVRSLRGQLLITKGQEVTFPVLERLRHWAQGSGIEEPVRVRIPCRSLAAQPA